MCPPKNSSLEITLLLLNVCYHASRNLNELLKRTAAQCTLRLSAWTTYLHGPSSDKNGTGACFIRAMPKIKRSVNGNSLKMICNAVRHITSRYVTYERNGGHDLKGIIHTELALER